MALDTLHSFGLLARLEGGNTSLLKVPGGGGGGGGAGEPPARAPPPSAVGF